MKTNSPVIIGLDIGTTKVVAIAAIQDMEGNIEIIGYGKAPSKGVEHGLVRNLEQCQESIELAIKSLRESNPNLEVNSVYVGIAGKHVKSLQNRGERIRADIESRISPAEIELLIQDQYKTYLPPGDKIIDIVPQDFTIDDERGITHPVGRTGTKLAANFHIITGGIHDIKNIYSCVHSAQLEVSEIVLQPMASAAAVMSVEELEMGVAIVDIGGGTTDMAIFKEGILHHTAVIPFAGEDITNDIKTSLGILQTHAEKMKTKFGSAVPSDAYKNKYITIPGIKGHEAKEIAYNNLAQIIGCRMEEIMKSVLQEIQNAGLKDKLFGGIILTGGGSHLASLRQLTSFVTKLPTRIGLPDEQISFSDEYKILKNPMYSTCIGLVLRGFEDLENGRGIFSASTSENKVYQTLENHDMDVTDLTETDLRGFVDLSGETFTPPVTESVVPITPDQELDTPSVPSDAVEPQPASKAEPKTEKPKTEKPKSTIKPKKNSKRLLNLSSVYDSMKNNFIELIGGEEDVEFDNE